MSSVNQQAGAAETQYADSKKQILECLRVHDLLEKQLRDWTVASQEGAGYEYSHDVDSLNKEVSELTEELQRLTSSHSVSELMVERLQLGGALLKELFPPDNPGTPSSLVPLLEERDECAMEILSIVKDNHAIEENIIRLKKESRELKEKNRKSLEDVRRAEECQRSQLPPNAEARHTQRYEDLTSITERVVALRFILQALITGSGIDWCKDDDLKSFLISLGEPLDFDIRDKTVDT